MDNLSNHFLIAMPGLADFNFFQTVTYIVEHNANGAMGIIINRPLDVTIDEIFQQLEIKTLGEAKGIKAPVYLGGPVQEERGFVLHDGNCETWLSSIQIGDSLCVTTSRDILEAIAIGKGPEQSLIALGYAGWSAGQLEREIAENSWLSGEVDRDIIFSTPAEQRWSAAASLLGVDISLLSSETGHA